MCRHERGEGLVVFPADHAFLGDEDFVEEGVVHQFSLGLVSGEVGTVGMLCPGHGPCDGVFDLGFGEAGRCQDPARRQDVSGDPVLFSFEEVQRDGFGVVGAE